jgi:divalent metal cation (Fe/Co/Zn/Cd) transporter
MGARLVWSSSSALLDAAMSREDVARVSAVLDRYRSETVDFHGLQTRVSGRTRFVSVHVLVPGAWSVQQAHDLVEEVEADLRIELEQVEVTTHVEPREDDRSYADHRFDATHRDD